MTVPQLVSAHCPRDLHLQSLVNVTTSTLVDGSQDLTDEQVQRILSRLKPAIKKHVVLKSLLPYLQKWQVFMESEEEHLISTMYESSEQVRATSWEVPLRFHPPSPHFATAVFLHCRRDVLTVLSTVFSLTCPLYFVLQHSRTMATIYVVSCYSKATRKHFGIFIVYTELAPTHFGIL